MDRLGKCNRGTHRKTGNEVLANGITIFWDNRTLSTKNCEMVKALYPCCNSSKFVYVTTACSLRYGTGKCNKCAYRIGLEHKKQRLKIAVLSLKDEYISDGSVIYWSHPRQYDGKKRFIEVECGICHKIRLVRSEGLNRCRKRNSGKCVNCAASAKLLKDSSTYHEAILQRGYMVRRLDSFTTEEQIILSLMCHKQVNSLTFRRIEEHRAIVALALKRPLNKNEVVHHINGIKTDNRLENLELLTKNTHHMGWSFDGTLELQNLKLRRQLEILNIIPCC